MTDQEGYVDQPAFVRGMAETVATLRTLSQAIADAPNDHGHNPWDPSRAMSDLFAEADLQRRCGDDWLTPVKDAHTFGGMTLMAASDYGHCYASLFDTGLERAPVYGHLAIARAGLEACIVSSWLNEPGIETVERVKRALCELIYSAWEVKRLELEGDDKTTELLASLMRISESFGWTLSDDRGKPKLDTTRRPSIPRRIAEIVVGDRRREIGKVQWSYLSSVIHVTWYGLRQAVVEGPSDEAGVGPSIAMVGTEARAVNAQSVCLLRMLRYAGAARFTLMGWADEEWIDACRQAESHENSLLKAITASQDQ